MHLAIPRRPGKALVSRRCGSGRRIGGRTACLAAAKGWRTRFPEGLLAPRTETFAPVRERRWREGMFMRGN
jgi:hypothetical protein